MMRTLPAARTAVPPMWYAPEDAVAAEVVDRAQDAPVPAIRWIKVVLLVLALPLFGQLFSYVKELPAMWSLAKAFPVVSTPFALFLLRRERMEGSRQILFTFLFLVIVSSLIAGYTFNQGFFRSLTAQVKLLPLLSAFNFLGFLYWLRPSLREMTIGFVICGALTFALLVFLWFTLSQDHYAQSFAAGAAQMFSTDFRGNRIRMPVYIAQIAMFYWWRCFLLTRRPHDLLFAGIGFGLIVYMVKLRAMVISLAAIAAINAFMAAPPRWRLLVLLLLPVAGVLLFRVGYLATVFDTQDVGYVIRQVTSDKAVEFLGSNPFLWTFGAGSISTLDVSGMLRYFNHFFYLSDITWMGVIFEFGLVGALLIAALPLRGMMIGHRLRKVIDTPFVGALQDSLFYTLVISPLFPITAAPGQMVMALACFAYIRSLIRDAARAEPA